MRAFVDLRRTDPALLQDIEVYSQGWVVNLTWKQYNIIQGWINQELARDFPQGGAWQRDTLATHLTEDACKSMAHGAMDDQT